MKPILIAVAVVFALLLFVVIEGDRPIHLTYRQELPNRGALANSRDDTRQAFSAESPLPTMVSTVGSATASNEATPATSTPAAPPQLSRQLELKDLAGVWVGGEERTEFLRAEFDTNGKGVIVGFIDGKEVNFVSGPIEMKSPFGWTGSFKAVNGGQDMKVTAALAMTSMHITIKDDQVNWKREFSLRRIDALNADIDATERRALNLKHEISH